MRSSISKQKSWLIFILFLFISPVFAANGHVYLGGTIASSWAKVGNNNPQINYYDGLLTDAYPISGNQPTRAIISVNGGYEFVGTGYVPAIALGLGIYGTPRDYDYKGQLIETALGDPSSTLYSYKFQVASTRFMFEAQFTWMLNNLMPFINLGVGSTWNRQSGYTESPVDNTGCVALPPFQSHTKTNVAYQLGLGVSYAFNLTSGILDYQHERISLGYRYANLGNASFGTRGVDYPHNLDIGRLTSNEVYLSYTHLF